MLFNSLDFAVFLPAVFFFYWFVFHRRLSYQNLFLAAASYLFYGWWDWRFLLLIFISTVVDFTAGLALTRTEIPARRKLLLTASLVVNLGFLGVFKYYNFFLENFTAAFRFFGAEIGADSLQVVLPVGISFYTFQTLSYTIDVYRRKLEPTRDFIAFSAFVSFFPQLVAGPIERATNLLPQFFSHRSFSYSDAVSGLRQMLWGFFKKVVIADTCAVFVDLIFADPGAFSGSTLLLGAFLFAFQIYGDFSGYSDIAIGTARLFGFRLMRNFAYPYFSRDIAEFWRRWHISLSTWFRDYLYIPLGGSRGNTAMRVRNTFIIFLVSGFWHGANWTFIIWGALHALFFLPLLLSNRNRRHLAYPAEGRSLPTAGELLGMVRTFTLTLFAWIFFRAESLGHAAGYISGIFTPSLFTVPQFTTDDQLVTTLIMIAVLLAVEWMGRGQEYALERLPNVNSPTLRYLSYYLVAVMILAFGNFGDNQFIYFQF